MVKWQSTRRTPLHDALQTAGGIRAARSVNRSLLYTICTYSHYYCDFSVVHKKKRPTRNYVRGTQPAAPLPHVHKSCHTITLQRRTERCLDERLPLTAKCAKFNHTSCWLLQPNLASCHTHTYTHAGTSKAPFRFPPLCTFLCTFLSLSHTYRCPLLWPRSRPTCAWTSSCNARRTRCTASWAQQGLHATQEWTAGSNKSRCQTCQKQC
jgi:hypothetical protein